MTDVLLRPCTIEDLETLCAFSRRVFYEAFGEANTPGNMDAFLNGAYGADQLRKELSDPDSSFLFLYRGDTLVGYIKLNEAPAQTDIRDADSLELERIYVSKDAQGVGLGSYMMERALETAKRKGKKYIWLGVWEKNTKALSFYRKHGFYEIGAHPFLLGDDVQTDILLRRDLRQAGSSPS